ncbi:Hypothetical predicted protein [Mytilus galloprovincialis]|uniref:Uncharacterized protein n=1 Tax=Mytilus galloprovincialis TaxID=29158 RepID=A0A8B6F2A6_MYTGA|nr:Hypothetical predicted protein [Mytilus galloprovincialis]
MSHKRVKTLHTISSAERLANLKDAAIRACDAEMIDRIEKENLLNKAVYHAACLTTYLAYRPKSNDKSATIRVRSGIKSEADHMHGQTQKAAMKRDEEHVRTLINHLTERMTNPFDISLHPECLINISTGSHVSPEIQKSLLTAIETGDKNLRSFVNNAFSTDGKSSFYSPLSRSNLKTFADMSKKTPFRSRTGDTLHIHVDPELVFRRALTLSSSRDDVSLQKIMEHPIGPVPTSIFHDDGSMRKSVKAELLHKLEETASSVPVLPDFDKSKTVFIRDGMAIVQTFHVKKSSTFGDLANDYVARALSNYHQSETVIDVFDRYDVFNL